MNIVRLDTIKQREKTYRIEPVPDISCEVEWKGYEVLQCLLVPGSGISENRRGYFLTVLT